MFPNGFNFGGNLLGGFSRGIDDHISPVVEHLFESGRVDVHGNHRAGPQGLGRLNHVLAHPAHPDDNDVVPHFQIRPPSRLKRCGRGIGHHRQVFQGNVTPIPDLTQINRRHRDVAGKTAVDADAVPGHFLVQASIAPSDFTQVALAARHHRRNQHFLADPGGIAGHHRSGNLMSQGQGRLGYRRDTIVEIPEIGMANPAPGHFHQHIPRAQIRNRNLCFFELSGCDRPGLLVADRRLDHLPGQNFVRCCRHGIPP